ncbi:MAG TPA: class II aldolase/adducin family protein [bacterium]|nr:class II aldolase/adducin family protein [bacterium]
MDREEIFKQFRAIGRAALVVDIENTHSGNIAMRVQDDGGTECLAITATGSPKGDLTPDKICYPSLTETNYGYFKSSTETDIHALILQIPGANASMHGHTKTATVVTMDDAPHPRVNPRAPFVPADPLGARYLGEVGVDYFKVASGSREMADGIRSRLTANVATIVQTHGAFARGRTLAEALFYLCLVEHSGEVIFWGRAAGADLAGARERLGARRAALERELPEYSAEDDGRDDFADEPDTVENFLTVGYRIFESRLSPFHTGSMSVRGATSMLYLPKASLPHELEGPMLELPLKSEKRGNERKDERGNERGDARGDERVRARAPLCDVDDSYELAVHRAIYAETPLKTVVHCYPSEVEVEAMLARPEAGQRIARIIPVDVEGGFLYPAIPVLPAGVGAVELGKALLDYHMAIVDGGGIWAAGEQSLFEAVRHVSSAKDICRYRIMSRMRGLDLAAMEPKRSRSW